MAQHPLPGQNDPRAWLEARIRQLQQEIDAALGDAAQVSEALGHHGDTGDSSVADDQATADFSDARRDLQELHACEAALDRLDEGRYGMCTDCTQAIDPLRLQAQPSAARCLYCQERWERWEREHGGREWESNPPGTSGAPHRV